MTDETRDAMLMAAFAAPAPAPDPAFVRRIERAVQAERALYAARARAWRQFGHEAAAVAAIVLVVAPLWQAGVFGPGMAAPGWTAIGMLGLGLATMVWPMTREA